LAPNSKDPPAELPPNPADAVILLAGAPNENPEKGCWGCCWGCCCAVPLEGPNVTPLAAPEKIFGILSPPPVRAPALAPPRPRFRGAILNQAYSSTPPPSDTKREGKIVDQGERKE